jgi:hypothetical protein
MADINQRIDTAPKVEPFCSNRQEQWLRPRMTGGTGGMPSFRTGNPAFRAGFRQSASGAGMFITKVFPTPKITDASVENLFEANSERPSATRGRHALHASVAREITLGASGCRSAVC